MLYICIYVRWYTHVIDLTHYTMHLYIYSPIGKTHMALAIGYECGLDFHVIKGPELLDKYIGASEKAIRSLFTRAMQSGIGLILSYE